MTKRVILYRRISTDEGRQRHSLGHQQDVLVHYCDAMGYQIVQNVAEEYSAKTFDRPEWRKLKEFIKKNKNSVDAILFTMWDRFSRNLEFALFEKRQLAKYGVEVYCIEQPLDLTIRDSKVMLSFHLSIAELENDKNSDRTSDASRKARLKGCWTGTAPFGYKNSRDILGFSTLEPTENAPLVQAIFDEMATGNYAADTVRKFFLRKGHKLPTKQAFLNMLRNIAYIGKVTVKKYKDHPYEEVPGLHPAIVNEMTFFKVQTLLSNKKKKRMPLANESQVRYPLKGHLVCKSFQHHMVAYKTSKTHKEYHYYECQICRERYNEQLVENAFLDFLENIQPKEEVLNLYIKIVEDILETNDGDRRTQIKKIDEQIILINEKMISLKTKCSQTISM